EPSRVLAGTVREEGTGKPVAGVIVQANGHTLANRPVTDARGHFRFLGLPKAQQHTLWFTPPADAHLIGRSVRVTAADDSFDPIQVNVQLPRGVIVTGR